MNIYITEETAVQTPAPRNLSKAMRQSEGTPLALGFLIAVAAVAVAGCASTPPAKAAYVEPRNSLVGPPGPTGPVGPSGIQGEIGNTGAPGTALVGPRGAEGPAGAAGPRGPTGATGPAGSVEIGQAGIAGPTGPAGVQGERGMTGVQGESTAGFAGQPGLTGPTGAQGERGDTGARGSTLVGPTGPAGAQGASGSQGMIGETGHQGSTTAGIAGQVGSRGNVGEKGATGMTGREGPAGVIGHWTSYRDFWFAPGTAGILGSDTNKVTEIAAYMRQNPSVQLGIDTFNDSHDQRLRDRRVDAVRSALIQAGVSEMRISAGSFGATAPRREARVEVLIATSANYSSLQR